MLGSFHKQIMIWYCLLGLWEDPWGKGAGIAQVGRKWRGTVERSAREAQHAWRGDPEFATHDKLILYLPLFGWLLDWYTFITALDSRWEKQVLERSSKVIQILGPDSSIDHIINRIKSCFDSDQPCYSSHGKSFLCFHNYASILLSILAVILLTVLSRMIVEQTTS